MAAWPHLESLLAVFSNSGALRVEIARGLVRGYQLLLPDEPAVSFETVKCATGVKVVRSRVEHPLRDALATQTCAVRARVA